MIASRDDQSIILELIRSANTPLTAKQVAQNWLGATGQEKVRIVQILLEELSAAGRTFEFPPQKEGFSKRFGVAPPLEFICGRILSLVEDSGGRITQQGARAALKKWEREYYDQAIGKLAREKKLFYLTVRYKFLVSEPPTPFDHLLPRQVTALREILERINRHRKTALTIEELKTFLNVYDLVKVLPGAVSEKLSEDLLREWYNNDLPRRGGLASVPIPWTWSHYESWCISNKTKPDLGKFQDFMLHLHRAGKIELIAHSMTQSLPDRESEIALKGQHGEVLYYWKWR